MTGTDFAIIRAQSHRRMIDLGHLAKRQTPFVIQRASISNAASEPKALASGTSAIEAGTFPKVSS